MRAPVPLTCFALPLTCHVCALIRFPPRVRLAQALLTPFLDREAAAQDETDADPYAHARRKELLAAAQTSAAIMFECFV